MRRRPEPIDADFISIYIIAIVVVVAIVSISLYGAAHGQDIETPLVRVDTGNPWLDLGFVLIILVVIALLFRRRRG